MPESANQPGPYRVERVQSADGPAWRLTGPGLDDAKAYPWEEFREKLQEMAQLMNFAWGQALRVNATKLSEPPIPDPHPNTDKPPTPHHRS